MRPGCGSPSVSRRNWSVARVSSTSSNRWGPEGAFPTPPPPTGATSRNRPPRGGLPDTSASGRGASFPRRSSDDSLSDPNLDLTVSDHQHGEGPAESPASQRLVEAEAVSRLPGGEGLPERFLRLRHH